MIDVFKHPSIEIRCCCIFNPSLGKNAKGHSTWVRVRSRSIDWRSRSFGPSSSKPNEGKKGTKTFPAEQHNWGRQSQQKMLTRLRKTEFPQTFILEWKSKWGENYHSGRQQAGCMLYLVVGINMYTPMGGRAQTNQGALDKWLSSSTKFGSRKY